MEKCEFCTKAFSKISDHCKECEFKPSDSQLFVWEFISQQPYSWISLDKIVASTFLSRSEVIGYILNLKNENLLEIYLDPRLTIQQEIYIRIKV